MVTKVLIQVFSGLSERMLDKACRMGSQYYWQLELVEVMKLFNYVGSGHPRIIIIAFNESWQGLMITIAKRKITTKFYYTVQSILQ